MAGKNLVRKINAPGKVVARAKQSVKGVMTIPLTLDEHLWIKVPPHISMIMLQNNQGTATDWFNVCFRIVCGLKIAEMCYIEDTVQEYKPGFESIQKVRENYLKTGKLEFPSIEDMDNISDCLRAADDMQDEVNRETQLYCYKKARTYMMQYINT